MTEHTEQRAPTIYDVADLAGVSHQTVSRFIKGHRVGEKSRSSVKNAIDQLGFQPNSAARALATRRSLRIGAITYELDQFGPITVLTGASAAARAAGYVMDIVSLDPFDEASVNEGISIFNQRDLAGILAFAPNDAVRLRLEATDFRVPVYFENEPDDSPDSIVPNINIRAGVLAAEHLLDLGHRNIAHLSGPLDWSAARLRTRGFVERLGQSRMTPTFSSAGNWSAQSGYDGAQLMLRRAPDSTALFVSNDQMAIGAMSALTQAGLRIPEDISVIGIDDAAESPFTIPPLTTIPMLFNEQGQHSFQVLRALIDGDDVAPSPPPSDIAVIARKSTGPARLS